MAKHSPNELRNVVLAGHAGAGKTILADAILLRGKAINRLGSIAEGTTTSDYEKEEREYGYSLSSAVLHASFPGAEINIVDTPGQSEFMGGLITGMLAGETACVCVNAARGVELVTRKAWDLAGDCGLARFVVVTRADSENVNLAEIIAGLQKTFGGKIVPFVLADGEGSGFKGVRPVLAAPADDAEAADLRQNIIDNALESDEALMEKYLEEGALADDELAALLPKAVAAGALVPLFIVAAEKDLGLAELIDGLVKYGPSPLQARRELVVDEDGRAPLVPAPDGPFLGQVFKVVSDAHVGKLSFVRVFSGKLEVKGSVNVSATGKPERIGQLLRAQGDKREDVAEARVGDIVVVPKIENLHIGDTLYGNGVDGRFPPLPLPQPMCGLAVSPKARGDEQKLGTNIHRLCEEDPTFVFVRDEHTGEQLIRGMGMVHLDVMLARLKSRYHMEVNTAPPKIPYLETITKPNEGSYRHKKQTGGSGQFAEVHLRIKPNERGKGFEFVDAIVGGVISGPFIPSVEKGVVKGMEHGPVAGYPLVDVIVELFFGKEHPVDSKDIAFQIAGEIGFKEIVAGCKPVLLEPIVDMEIVFPGRYFGDISGDISSRRGRPTGTDQLGDMQVLRAQVPLAEVSDYGSTIKAITQGEGSFAMTLSHYEPVPSNIAQHVVAKLKEAAEAKK